MLVKIYYSIDERAVQDTETAFINPEHISDTRYTENDRLIISMLSGKEYIITSPGSLLEAAGQSKSLQVLYSEYKEKVEKEIEDQLERVDTSEAYAWDRFFKEKE